jgi:hypothetical protein
VNPDASQARPNGSAEPPTAGKIAPISFPRRRWLLGGVATVVVAGIVVALTFSLLDGQHPARGPASASDATSLATVGRKNLESQTEVDGTLGYAGRYSVVNQTPGIFTALPQAGADIARGQVLYEVNRSPVVLLYDNTPAYRSMSEGMTGGDISNLNANLVTLGYATESHIALDPEKFTRWTKAAVEKLQADHGLPQTGTLALGQAVFLPGEARVTTISATLGAPAQPGQPVLVATSTSRQVTIALDATQQSEVAVGDKVTITLPDTTTTPGIVSSVGTVATPPPTGSSNTPPTVSVVVTPSKGAATGNLDQAPVQVSITTAGVKNALVVPVDALLAQAGGGYAVEVVPPNAHRQHQFVRVTLGLFDDADGLVQVSGSSLAAGQRVVVPSA